MAEQAAPAAETTGPASTGQESPATGAAPAADSGPGIAGKGTRSTPAPADTPSQDTEPTFFDPKTLPDELKPAYKQMQQAFTRKMQQLSGERNKAQFYDQFSADPIGNMQRLASQYGYQLTRAQAAEAVHQQGAGDLPPDWTPQSWQEVLSKAEERATQKIFGQLQPLLSEVKNQKRQSIEKQLEEIDPTWRQYESEMVQLIQEVPGLAAHPERLYRLAVPPEVIESRATQKAIQRLQDKAKASAGAGGSTTIKRPSAADPNQRFASVHEAALWAQKKLEEEGKWPPRR